MARHWGTTFRPKVFVEHCATIRASAVLIRQAMFSTLVVRDERGAGRDVRIDIVWTQLTFGRQGWFSCPACSRRAAVLYSPKANLPFFCRRCWRVDYLKRFPTRLLIARLAGTGPWPWDDRFGDLHPRRVGVHRPRGVTRRRKRLLLSRAVAGQPPLDV